MKKSESIKNVSTAIFNVSKEIQPITRNAKNPYYNSNYSTLDNILTVLKPLLIKNGLIVVQSSYIESEHYTVETTIIHVESQEFIATTMPLKSDKPTPQGSGAVDTYGRRYGICAAFNITSEDDNDGNDKQNNGNVKTHQHDSPQQNISQSNRLDFNKIQEEVNVMNCVEEMKSYFDLIKGKHTLSEKQEYALKKIFSKAAESKGSQIEINWGGF